jgi:arylsulfatase A-like enzyme
MKTRTVHLFALLALLSVLLGEARAQSPSPVDHPNVLVIVLDDVGWDDLAAAPVRNLETFGAFGRIYPRFYSAPVCSPSRYMALFGRLAHRELIGTAIDIENPLATGAPADNLSLAEALKAEGYTTGMFGKWHVSGPADGPVEHAPMVQGFDTWRAGIAANVGLTRSHYDWDRNDDGVVTNETTYSTRAITEAFIDWWPNQTGPRFAMVGLNAPHEPFESAAPSGLLPPGYTVVDTPRGLFESAIVAIDTAFGQMASVIDLSNTYVLLVSDNGTPPTALLPSQLLQGFKGSVNEGGVRVPCVLWGVDTQPGFDHSLTHIVDLPRTVLDLVGVAPASDFDDSISFAGTRIGQAGQREFAFSHLFFPNGSQPLIFGEAWTVVRSDGLKLIYQFKKFHLFDVGIDPFETNDLSANGLLYFAESVKLASYRIQKLFPEWPY